MKKRFGALYVLMALAIGISWFYSLGHSIIWLVLTLMGLAFGLGGLVGALSIFKNHLVRLLVGVFLLEVLALYQVGRLLSYYFQGEGFNERFWFHFNVNSLSEAGGAFVPLILFCSLFFILVAWIGSRLLLGGSALFPLRFSVSLLLLTAFFAIEPDLRSCAIQGFQDFFYKERISSVDDIPWQKVGLNPLALTKNLKGITAGKNLVLIYLESVEKIYSEPGIFADLMPQIRRLSGEALTFNNIQQTPGTDWTVGGIVASQCGTPLLTGFSQDGNDLLHNGFLDRAVCLGDLLAAAGYRNAFLGGASTRFAGKGAFLKAHGYDEVLGLDDLAPLLRDSDYRSGWGLFDDSLFDLALQKYRELAQNPPFNLTLLTLDTHHPNGDPSRSCPRYDLKDNSMLHAVHCTDFLVGQFIEELRRHPAWNNTIVVIVSDHLAMRNVAQDYYPDDYPRKLLFMVIHGERNGEVAVRGTHMDIAPTILEVMRVGHDQKFLAGDSLLGVKKERNFSAETMAQRLNAIRYVNSRHFTRRSENLWHCEELVAVRNGRLTIGGTPVKMSVAGFPLPLSSLESSHAVLAILTPEGNMAATLTVNIHNLPHVLYLNRNSSYLLVGPTAHLPDLLKSPPSKEKISVVLGRWHGKTWLLGGGNGIDGLRVSGPLGQDTLATVSGSLAEAESVERAALGGICLAPESAPAVMDRSAGTLHLPRVAYAGAWWEVWFKGNLQEGYEPSEIKMLRPIAPTDQTWYCHAVISDKLLLIPAVRVGAEIRDLILSGGLESRARWKEAKQP